MARERPDGAGARDPRAPAGPMKLALLGMLAISPARLLGADAPARFTFARPLMGTEFRIVVHATDSSAAHAAADRAFARIAELERVLSDYDPTSELSRLSATAGEGRWVRVSDDLWRVLTRAMEWSDRTGGAFDITVGPLTRLWRRAARRGSLPSSGEILAARGAVDYELLELDPVHRSVRLGKTGMRLDAGGIGKGYAADAALELLAGRGFPSALVDAGGDIVAGDPPPGEKGWRVELPFSEGIGAAHPGPRAARGTGADAGCVLHLANAAVATSGDSYRGIEVDGVRHSHILDPRTGSALTHRRTVTVLAPTATEADLLASALSVLTPGEGRALLDAYPEAGARLVEREGLPLPPSDSADPHLCPDPS